MNDSYNTHTIFGIIVDANLLFYYLGIPFDLNIHSSSTGRYKTHYNLSWTLKSFAPIQKTELQFKRKVCIALNTKWSFSPLIFPVFAVMVAV